MLQTSIKFLLVLGKILCRIQYFKLDALKRYLEDAAHNGIAVKIVLRNGPHSTIALENQILLAREYADFLRDNK